MNVALTFHHIFFDFNIVITMIVSFSSYIP